MQIVRRLLITILLVFPSVAPASERQALFGVWGSDKQCARELLIPTGSVRAAPFEIDNDWLRQGQVWCRLNWITTSKTSTGLFAMALALCGEDDVRDYRLTFDLKNERLTLKWTEHIENRQLKRCVR